MEGIQLSHIPTIETFDEEGYLAANPDVRRAVAGGAFASGREHFIKHGENEGRPQRNVSAIASARAEKRKWIRPLLRTDMLCIDDGSCFDFLTDELRESARVVDTDNVSSNPYREESLALIDKHHNGIILDCGSGQRPVAYSNVVNFEIVDYDTTDVRGVGEKLPFKDNSFDAVFSLAVLEHVRDPFQCAREISRVLKPGGDLLCVLPFLQPMHGYPHHYFNATPQGLRELFERTIDIKEHKVRLYDHPIFSLTWILGSWIRGLEGDALEEFKNMKVSDLLGSPLSYTERSFVASLSRNAQFELAAGTCILGNKRPSVNVVRNSWHGIIRDRIGLMRRK